MRILFLLVALQFATAFAAQSKSGEKVLAALGVLIDEPASLGSDRYNAAMETCQSLLTTELLSVLSALPEQAVARIPIQGRCHQPLLLAFTTSLMRDRMLGRTEDSLYRGWLVVLHHYRHLREAYPEEVATEPVLEAMIKKEAAGALRAEAAELEANSKKTEGTKSQPVNRQ